MPPSISKLKNIYESNEQILDLLRLKPKVLAMLNNIVSASIAEEIAQEAYIAVLARVKSGALASAGPYLMTTAKRMALSSLRHEKVRTAYQMTQLHQTDILSCPLEQKLVDDESNAMLLAAINQLPPICRKVFILRKIEDKSHDEIASTLGISKKTVQNHLAKGLKLCREFLAKEEQHVPRNRVG